MRILYITNGICGVGGLERVLSVKASWLAGQPEIEVAVCSINEQDKTPFYSFSEKILRYNIDPGTGMVSYIRSYVKEIKKVLKEFRPDIVSVCDDGLKGILFSRLWNHKDFGLIYERHVSRIINGKDSLIKRNIIKWGTSGFDSVVLLTEGNRSEWNFLKNITIISNPLSFPVKDRSDLKNKKVIAAGKITHQKGFDMLAEAWVKVKNNYPDWEMHIYGGESEASGIVDEIIKKNNLQKNFFVHKPEPDIRKKYLESSIYVMSSRYEGFGMVLTEAMSCGVPCISFDCPCGPSDIINHEEDGFLVPAGDTDILAERIQQLMNSYTLRYEMGRSARENCKRFEIEEIGRQWLDLFEKIREEKI